MAFQGISRLRTIHRVYQVVTESPDQSDQFPYRDIWQSFAAHPLPWIKKCFEDNCKILMAKTMTNGTVKRTKERKTDF
jgi:hypothetical protein